MDKTIHGPDVDKWYGIFSKILAEDDAHFSKPDKVVLATWRVFIRFAAIENRTIPEFEETPFYLATIEFILKNDSEAESIFHDVLDYYMNMENYEETPDFIADGASRLYTQILTMAETLMIKYIEG
jgi:hypothetical protein